MTDTQEQFALESRKEFDALLKQAELRTSVKLSLEAERKRLERDERRDRDFWLELNEANYYPLVSSALLEVRLRREFEEVLGLAPSAWADSIRESLDIFDKLDLLGHNVKVAREVFDAFAAKRRWNAAKPQKVKDHILLFVGHRLEQNGAALTTGLTASTRLTIGRRSKSN